MALFHTEPAFNLGATETNREEKKQTKSEPQNRLYTSPQADNSISVMVKTSNKIWEVWQNTKEYDKKN
jgi:hypothetical protein